MGLFSDTCRALVDKTTGKALAGKALQDALQDPGWPRCGHAVKKAALFCAKCGAPAPGGWWQCPGCGKKVGNESEFCWNCKQALHPESRNEVAGGQWQKGFEQFARRLEVGDILALVKNGLEIQTGTAAILLDGGAYKDVLGPGRHTLESLARKINWWGDPPPRTAILVDNGDVTLPLRFEGLRSHEELPLDLQIEAVFHFSEKGAPAFVANLFKSRDWLMADEIAEILRAELRYAVTTLCATSTADDLVKDPQRRLQVEDALETTLKTALERYGLELVRVAAAEFSGKEFDALRAQAGALELRRREIEFGQRLRELVASEKMHLFKSEQDLEDYVKQLAQERAISAEKRDRELALLKMVQRHELDQKEAAYRMACEIEKAAHEIKVKIQWDDYTRDRQTKDARLQDELAKMTTAREVDEALKWIDVRAKKKAFERQDYAERAAVQDKLSLQTLVAMTDDPARREALLKLNEQLQAQGKSADVILALQAGRNPDVVRVLAEMERAKREDRDKDWAERKNLLDESAERLERILKSALETTAEAARHPGTTTHVVK